MGLDKAYKEIFSSKNLHENLSKINPGLIMVRITGFGQTGPNSHRPGFGTLAEGYAGFASITGYSDRPPLLPGFGLADETSGLMGAYLALAALRERDQNSGRVQIVEFGIYEPLFTLLGPQVVDYDQLGIIQERNGSRLPFTAPRNTYRTRDDKWVSISGSAQSTFERMCEALNVPGLINDPRFLDNRLRIQNAEALDDALQNAILEFDRDNLIELFDEFGAAVAAGDTLLPLSPCRYCQFVRAIAGIDHMVCGIAADWHHHLDVRVFGFFGADCDGNCVADKSPCSIHRPLSWRISARRFCACFLSNFVSTNFSHSGQRFFSSASCKSSPVLIRTTSELVKNFG